MSHLIISGKALERSKLVQSGHPLILGLRLGLRLGLLHLGLLHLGLLHLCMLHLGLLHLGLLHLGLLHLGLLLAHPRAHHSHLLLPPMRSTHLIETNAIHTTRKHRRNIA